MICKVCGGTGEVVIPPTMEQPEDAVPCDRCLETGVEPPDAPEWMDESEMEMDAPRSAWDAMSSWSEYYDHYREQGMDDHESATLANRDMADPRDEQLVYY